MALTGTVSPASSTHRQQSAGYEAAAANNAALAARRGTNGAGKLVEPTKATGDNRPWPRLVFATETYGIAGEGGRYTAKLWHPKTDGTATGDMTMDNLGKVCDDDVIEVWHQPDAVVGGWTLTPYSIVLGYIAEEVSSRGKMVVVTLPWAIPSGVFMVALNQTGGDEGGASGPPTWTYQISGFGTVPPADHALATDATPMYGRPSAGKCLAAYAGLAMLNYATGKVDLIQAFETPVTTQCGT